MSLANLKGMPDAEWDRHQRIIADFETAWAKGHRPKIRHYLPSDDPRRDELLIELVHADLEFRIKAGESVRVEDYLRKYPSLSGMKETVLDLIRTECTIRRRKEPGLKLDRYRRRFPTLLAELDGPGGDSSTVEGLATPPPKSEGRSKPALDGPLPRLFGKFELREKLGVGAFGVVYRAWDTVLKRQVAVKMPKVAGATFGPEARVFLRDARHSLHLKHPNIVETLDAGPVDGVDCIVRAYIEGQTLADRLREGPLGVREAASLVGVVAGAIDHVHRRKIVHRDLKPSNILIDPQGRPHIMDFGLAKDEAGESTLSPEGSPGVLIGTLAYMSPEQSRGETYLVDARTDVYALGVVLYELLTGSLPFRGRGRMLQVQIEEVVPIPPRELNDEVPAGLETICLKALAKAPADRHQSAQELADDLSHYLDGRPVEAKPDSIRRTASKPWWRSPRRVATLAARSALLLALGWTSGLWLQADARRARDAEGLERTYRALLDLASRDDSGKARELVETLDSTLDSDPSLVEVAADARLGLAARASLGGSDASAGPLWDRAIAACEGSIATSPGRLSRSEDLAGALTSRGLIWLRAGEPKRARGMFDRAIGLRLKAIETLERDAEGRPDDVDARLDQAEVSFRLAEVRRIVGEPAEFDEVGSIARDLARRSSSESPSDRPRLASLMLDLSRRELAEARPLLAVESAADGHRLALEAETGSASASLVANACLLLVRADRVLGRESEAIERAAEAVRRFEGLVRSGPGRPEDRMGLGEALFETARLLDQPGRDRALAIKGHREALRVRLDLARDHPGAHVILAQVGESRLALARIFEAEGRTIPAVANRLSAGLALARTVALAPGEASYRRRLGEVVRPFHGR